jgi:hypothetical protein
VLLVGLLGTVAALAIFGAFTSSTTSPNNQFSAGTVAIADNDSGSALYNVANRKPGDTVTSCIKVTYTGTLPSEVRLYTTSTVNTLAQYVDLVITPGTQATSSFPDCTGFVPDSGGAIYSGTLQNFAATKNSWANGVVDFPGSSTSWAQNNAVVYRFQVTLQAATPDSQQGQATGSHAFTWEARNQ